MNVLIIKLGATGGVVRTTALLKRIEGQVTWITGSKNMYYWIDWLRTFALSRGTSAT